MNIRAALPLTDFTRDGVDMAVRFGPGTWPGLSSIKLYDEELVPVCSPAFRGGRLPRIPADLLKVALLHDERQPWSIWFEAVGLDYRNAGQRPRYSDENLLFPAAIAGLGVALARASLVEADLESGRLVRLFSRTVPTRYSYFIVYPPGSETPQKSSCSSSGCSSRSRVPSDRAPSALKPDRTWHVALRGRSGVDGSQAPEPNRRGAPTGSQVSVMGQRSLARRRFMPQISVGAELIGIVKQPLHVFGIERLMVRIVEVRPDVREVEIHPSCRAV